MTTPQSVQNELVSIAYKGTVDLPSAIAICNRISASVREETLKKCLEVVEGMKGRPGEIVYGEEGYSSSFRSALDGILSALQKLSD